MRQLYNRSFTVVWKTGDSGYVFADKVDPGSILHVLSCTAYSPDREASDNVIIGIRNGGQDIILTAQKPLAAQRGVDTPTPFLVGESDQLFAYFPDVDNNDSIGIHINGVLLLLPEWSRFWE